MKTSLIFCFTILLPIAAASQETVTPDDGVLQYIVPDPDLNIFASDDVQENDQIFLGIELEVLERRVTMLESENEMLRARVDRIESILSRGDQ